MNNQLASAISSTSPSPACPAAISPRFVHKFPVYNQTPLNPLHLADQLAALKHVAKVLVIARRPIAKDLCGGGQ
jgi:hypothetical protein